MATFPGDFGIIFQGTTGTPGMYVDVLGQTRNEVQLTSLTPVRMPVDVTSAFVHAGLARRFSLFVTVVRVASTVDLKLQGHYDIDPTAAWADVFQFNNADPTSTTVTKTFSASGDYLLQTSNVGAVPEASILVTPGSGFSGSISVRLVALP